jgi:hypothetical protein
MIYKHWCNIYICKRAYPHNLWCPPVVFVGYQPCHLTRLVRSIYHKLNRYIIFTGEQQLWPFTDIINCYNWLLLWDYTFHKWGHLVFLMVFRAVPGTLWYNVAEKSTDDWTMKMNTMHTRFQLPCLMTGGSFPLITIFITIHHHYSSWLTI